MQSHKESGQLDQRTCWSKDKQQRMNRPPIRAALPTHCWPSLFRILQAARLLVKLEEQPTTRSSNIERSLIRTDASSLLRASARSVKPSGNQRVIVKSGGCEVAIGPASGLATDEWLVYLLGGKFSPAGQRRARPRSHYASFLPLFAG